ncbi:hypothetical protein CAEBREN_16186 [Caenorhabditis brenneri]|uniref:Uncharacterized protein n=1 Tax=Caenorhabditis brenneri TaxID=135651 RepID=G0MWQ1_CAEBE|nr:hypothetical protein CAEBREN_16186 [Caenorhabditis brenneri]
MDKLPEIIKFYDVPNQSEWVEVVLAFDPETKEYKIYKDKKLEHHTTNKQFVAKLSMTEPTIKKESKTIEVRKEEGFECKISVNGRGLDMAKADQRQKYDFWKINLFEGMEATLIYYEVEKKQICWKDRRISIPRGPIKHPFSLCQKSFEIELISKGGVFHTVLKMGGKVIPHFKGREGTSN